MIEKGADNIVLGCSHYPFLKPIIISLIPDNIQIIDSGAPVAKQTKSILLKNNLQSYQDDSPALSFYTNGEIEVLDSFIKNFNLNKAYTSFETF